ncbi:LysE family translocator [Solitalea sp. MAHUQ-68]|uniref:LysE family translocator n=1 Tax=Solitalea agri TaxID=2953739 RepID=A0A9X2F3W1_9SPHI|nr:LysE family transporter [Solitalea agri]MCO4293749.1 LysE family translocator [Solitalea agri]
MEQLYIFIIAFVASFIGSLQLGPVNLTVIQTSVNKDFRAAFWVSIGGCLPEILYAAIAVAGTSLIDPKSSFFFYAGFFMVPLLLGLGIFKIIKYKEPENTKPQEYPSTLFGDFAKGFTLSIVNPLLLPFWSTVLIYNTSINVFSLDTKTDKSLFVLGAAVGALGLLLLFAGIAHWKKERINKMVNGNINKAIGWVFVILGLVQLIVVGLRYKQLI